jgi:hypothetical protein
LFTVAREGVRHLADLFLRELDPVGERRSKLHDPPNHADLGRHEHHLEQARVVVDRALG